MFNTDTCSQSRRVNRHLAGICGSGTSAEPDAPASDPLTVLGEAVELLDRGRAEEADRLLTAALVAFPTEGDLWLAAGIARLRRGSVRSSAAALRMCSWISDDPFARELLWAIDGQC